jgi:hypothetical protein
MLSGSQIDYFLEIFEAFDDISAVIQLYKRIVCCCTSLATGDRRSQLMTPQLVIQYP